MYSPGMPGGPPQATSAQPMQHIGEWAALATGAAALQEAQLSSSFTTVGLLGRLVLLSCDTHDTHVPCATERVPCATERVSCATERVPFTPILYGVLVSDLPLLGFHTRSTQQTSSPGMHRSSETDYKAALAAVDATLPAPLPEVLPPQVPARTVLAPTRMQPRRPATPPSGGVVVRCALHRQCYSTADMSLGGCCRKRWLLVNEGIWSGGVIPGLFRRKARSRAMAFGRRLPVQSLLAADPVAGPIAGPTAGRVAGPTAGPIAGQRVRMDRLEHRQWRCAAAFSHWTRAMRVVAYCYCTPTLYRPLVAPSRWPLPFPAPCRRAQGGARATGDSTATRIKTRCCKVRKGFYKSTRQAMCSAPRIDVTANIPGVARFRQQEMAQFEAARRAAEGGLHPAAHHRRRATVDPTNDPSFFSPLSQGKAAEDLAVSSVPKAVYRDAAGPLGIGAGGAPQPTKPPRSAGQRQPRPSSLQPAAHAVPQVRVVPAAPAPVTGPQRSTMDEAEYLRSMAAAALAAVPQPHPARASSSKSDHASFAQPTPPVRPTPPAPAPPPVCAPPLPPAGRAAPSAVPSAAVPHGGQRPQPPSQAEILAAARALRPVDARPAAEARAAVVQPPPQHSAAAPPPVELDDVRRALLASVAARDAAPPRVDQALTAGMQARRAAMGASDDEEWDD